MHLSFRLLVLGSLAVAGLFPLAAGSVSAADSPAPQTLSPEQRRELQTLLGEFRQARKDLPKREALVDKAITLGVPAVASLLDVIERELYSQLNGYRERFFKSSEKAAISKFRSANLSEVTELRKKVLTLSQKDKLTGEEIKAVSDPAIRRLEELLVIDRQSVLDGSPELVKLRDAMSELGSLWEKCQVFLAKQAPPPEAQGQTEELPNFDKYLTREEELAAQLAVPMDAGTRGVLSGNARLATSIDAEEGRCVLALNLMRNLLGLGPVRIDPALCAAARDHSKDMETKKFFAHESPVPGKATPWDRAKNFNTSASAENIAMGTLDGTVANLMWWHSPGHHKNMLGNHARVGLGRSGRHWTEMFGR